MSDVIKNVLETVTTALSSDDLSAGDAKAALLAPLSTLSEHNDKDQTVILLNLLHFARNIDLFSTEMRDDIIAQCALAFPNPNVVLDERTGVTLFLHSLKENDTAVFEALLTKNPDINATDVLGYNSAYYAVMGDNLDRLKQLHELGVDITATTKNGETLLHAACANGDETIVDYLLENKLDPNATENLYGLTCMGTASVFTDNPAVIKKLQDNGAAFTKTGKDNLTPFELALQANNSLSIAYFIDTDQANSDMLDTSNIPAILDAALYETPNRRTADKEELEEGKRQTRLKNFALYTIERNLTLEDCLEHASSPDHIQVICRQFNKTPLDLLGMELDDDKASMVRIALMT